MSLRFKQMRNYLVALMMAVGTPMLVMGERVLMGWGWGLQPAPFHNSIATAIHGAQRQRALLLMLGSNCMMFC